MSKEEYFKALEEYVKELNQDKSLDFVRKVTLLADYSGALLVAFPEIRL